MLFLEINSDSIIDDIKGYTPNKLQEKIFSFYADEIVVVNSPSHNLRKLIF